ncbi:MAG: toxin YoeB [Ignavibacteria bacterium GWB2_35_12]|nr:MAG: toxin YoeB [Ignavibacteria bacterium GWA2_35_8]OGU38352.1 MAG: toxin YoeB [Ignavibacteria bacterium GWB2_35_12]OGU94200.1 MAG: toxin YoeB [Ignavibacteria bacterium RIFOXYA2_FULL_35_10]OGV23412.1 MAG: toxin YoeB [Ignavibacteria bacterium RIFOXYC2_FULL_35_21]
MRNILFQKDSFEEFLEWGNTDKKKQKKLGKLIVETIKNPFEGLGKPEPLKADLKGYWSRRIDEEHRLVYKVTVTSIIIISCKEHY